MSIARVWGVVTTGVSGVMVRVEVDVAQGLPSVGVVGLAGASVSESRWRVRSAIANIGAVWPAARITVGLSPADLPKTGTGLDLAIAVGVLLATAQVPPERVVRSTFVGELGLDGSVRAVPGALSAAIAARAHGIEVVHVASACAHQVRAVPGIEVVAIRDLAQLLAVLRGEGAGEPIPDAAPSAVAPSALVPNDDLADVRGQAQARFGLEVAAVGGHHLAMLGPPGVGKSMMATRLAGLLPDLDEAAALEVTSILSMTGRLPVGGELVRRPHTEAPHHSTSAAAFLGSASGARVLPGAITCAHRGVLVMDEAPEFNRACIEGLRQPLESGALTIARVGWAQRLPASFQLVLTANPCPCGHAVGRGSTCTCTPMSRRRYRERLSGPVLDRIDIRLDIGRPGRAEAAGESSAQVRARVEQAQARAARRFAGESWSRNAQIPTHALRREWAPAPDGVALMERVVADGGSMRGADRIGRLSWSIADLVGVDRPTAEHVSAAIALRIPDDR